MDLLKELETLLDQFADEQVDYALCGGLAMAVYALPRATLDVDLMIEPESLDRARRLASKLGFAKDVGLMTFREGAVQIHRLCKIVPDSKEELVLDFLLVTPDLQSVWESRKEVAWERGRLWVVSPEGLIVLKSMRGTGQDRDDIDFLRKIVDAT